MTIDDYRSEVISSIILSGSEEDVSRIIDTAMGRLEQHKVHAHIIARFVDKILDDLVDLPADAKNNIRVEKIESARSKLTIIKKRWVR